MIVNELVSVLRYQVQDGGLARFKRGLQTAAEAARRVGRNAKEFSGGFIDGARRAIQEQRSLQQALRKTGDAAKQSAEKTRDAASSVKNYVMGALAGLGLNSATDVADEWSGIRARVGLEIDKDQVDDTLKSLYAMAQENGAGYADTSSVYLPIVRNRKEMEVTNDEALKLTDTIGKLMSIGGGTAAGNAAALTQFGQAIGSGTLRGDELNSVIEQAPRLAKAVADAFEIPVGKLKDMASEGKLTAKELAKGLLKQSQKIEEEFKQMPATFGSGMTYIKNAMGLWIDRWARATKAADHFNKVVKVIADNLDHIAGAAGIAALLYIMMKLRTVSMAALLPMLKMAAVVAGLYLLGQDIMVWLRGGESFLGTLIGDVSEWQGTIDTIKSGFNWIKNLIGDTSSTTGDFATKWGAIGLVIFAVARPIMVVVGLLASAVGWVMKIAQAFWAVLKVAFVVGRFLLAFVSWPMLIAAAIVAAGVLIYQHFEAIKTFALNIWNMIASGFSSAFTAAVDFVANYIPAKLGQAFNAAKGLLNKILPDSMQLSTANAAAAGSVGAAPAVLQAAGATATVSNQINITANSNSPRDIANAAKSAIEGPSRSAGLAAARSMPNVEARP